MLGCMTSPCPRWRTARAPLRSVTNSKSPSRGFSGSTLETPCGGGCFPTGGHCCHNRAETSHGKSPSPTCARPVLRAMGEKEGIPPGSALSCHRGHGGGLLRAEGARPEANHHHQAHPSKQSRLPASQEPDP